MLCVSGFFVAPIRRRLFTRAFYAKNFPELSSDKLTRLPELGYPDMGAGQFSQKLALEDWMTFANAQVRESKEKERGGERENVNVRMLTNFKYLVASSLLTHSEHTTTVCIHRQEDVCVSSGCLR